MSAKSIGKKIGGAEKKKVTTIARTRGKSYRKQRVTYSPELVASILDRVANGEPLSRVCSGNDAPTRKSFFEWVIKYPEIKEQYEMAIAMRADLYAEQTVAISDEDIATVIRGDDGETEVVFDSTAVARNRLRVDARKWYASKLAPKKYGDRVEQVHSGAIGIGQVLAELDGASSGLPGAS